MTMTRIESRPIVAVGLSLAILGYVGCARTVETAEFGAAGDASRRVAAPGHPEGEAAPPADAGLFADWPGLKAALVITGEMDGYLDPCGCTDGQLGGLGRRYDLLERMQGQKIPSARIDLGSLTKDPAGERGGNVQAKIKFETALKAMTAMKYDALALSPEDLKHGIAETLSTYLNQKDAVRVVSANVAPAGASKEAFAGTIRESVVAEAGPYKVGITAVLDLGWYDRLKDPDREILEVRPPETVLPAVLKALEGSTDFQVLMVQGPPELALTLGEAFPGFDVVVSTSPFADPEGKTKPLNGGATQVVTVGQKGKYVGVIGLFDAAKGKAPEARYQKVSLIGGRFRNAEPMRALIDEQMQSQLKALGVVENYVRHANVEAPPGASYVGAEGCKSCHPNTFAKWAGTKHARAYEVLAHNPTDPRRNREFDAECISCHTTGFTYNTGWVSAEKTPYLKGNQCENCHGPGSKHVEQPDNKEFTRFLARTAEAADKGGLCLKCHDEDNSRNFNFGVYYGKIVHKGMDRYDDPAVHVGKAPGASRASQ